MTLPDLPAPSASLLLQAGRALLWGLGGLILALTFTLALTVPEAMWLVPAGLLGLCVLGALLAHPLAGFVALLAGFSMVARPSEGIGIVGFLYGGYLVIYMGLWYSRALASGQPIVQTVADRLIATFAVGGLALGLLTGVLHGAPADLLRGDLTTFLLLFLYFPVRDICLRSSKGPYIVAGAVVALGLIMAVQNLLFFRALMSSATVAWQIADVRYGATETFIFLAVVCLFVILVHLRHRGMVMFTGGLFLFMLGSLILTRGRTYWVAFALVLVLLFVLMDRRQRVRITVMLSAGLGALVIGAMVFLADAFSLLLDGTLHRLTMFTASDLSMMARWIEWDAILRYIAANPIVGYGFGTTYQYHDILEGATLVKEYCHNAYLAIWFKLGGLGLVVFVAFLARLILDAVRVYRVGSLDAGLRALNLFVLVSLVALVVVANTSIFFLVNDQIFAFVLVAGLASSLAVRCSATEDGRVDG